MTSHLWVKEFPNAITVCDTEGIILEMNDRAAKAFEEDGGLNLIGSNVLDCHPEPSRTQLREMLQTEQSNVYTIEKKGKKKLIYQSPWYDNGRYAGFLEMAIEIPQEMPHFIRG